MENESPTTRFETPEATTPEPPKTAGEDYAAFKQKRREMEDRHRRRGVGMDYEYTAPQSSTDAALKRQLRGTHDKGKLVNAFQDALDNFFGRNATWYAQKNADELKKYRGKQKEALLNLFNVWKNVMKTKISMQKELRNLEDTLFEADDMQKDYVIQIGNITGELNALDRTGKAGLDELVKKYDLPLKYYEDVDEYELRSSVMVKLYDEQMELETGKMLNITKKTECLDKIENIERDIEEVNLLEDSRKAHIYEFMRLLAQIKSGMPSPELVDLLGKDGLTTARNAYYDMEAFAKKHGISMNQYVQNATEQRITGTTEKDSGIREIAKKDRTAANAYIREQNQLQQEQERYITRQIEERRRARAM